jgi:hypothetical protein
VPLIIQRYFYVRRSLTVTAKRVSIPAFHTTEYDTIFGETYGERGYSTAQNPRRTAFVSQRQELAANPAR